MTDYKTYSGLFVGGPMNGKWAKSKEPYFRVPEQTSAKAMDGPNSGSTTIDKINVQSYKLVAGLRMSEKAFQPVDFWVPMDKDCQWAIEKVLEHFQNTATPEPVTP